MAEKAPHLHLCIVCGRYGSRDAFTPEGSSTCKRCSSTTISDLDQRMRGLGQKNYGDLLKKRTGEDGWQVKRKLAEKPKEQKPVREISAMAAGVKVNVEPEIRRKQKMADEIKSAKIIENNLYFYMGVEPCAGRAASTPPTICRRAADATLMCIILVVALLMFYMISP